MLVLLALMSLVLGLSSFGCGILPLSFVFSKSHLDRLSAFGTGLLLGAALGVIIPEGIETAVEADKTHVPTTTIALSLLFGFTFMLIIEQLVSPHAHSHSHHQTDNLSLHTVKSDSNKKPMDVEFDAELGDLEREEGIDHAGYMQPETPVPLAMPSNETVDATSRAFPLTFGLVVHGLADGLALGASSLAKSESGGSSSLSWIVFLALIIHKAPTSLALTTSLLATSLPRAKCKRHLVVFASSTPISAITSYLLFSFLGNGDGGWTGVALLVSGGTFLYVATVLQPVSGHSGSPSPGDMRSATRVFYITVGMFVPFFLSAVLGHGH
ncbi:Zinc/iron permease [Lyophyllum atratum]|nr:Zinc/iron permease [Lyophyllum atratum]